MWQFCPGSGLPTWRSLPIGVFEIRTSAHTKHGRHTFPQKMSDHTAPTNYDTNSSEWDTLYANYLHVQTANKHIVNVLNAANFQMQRHVAARTDAEHRLFRAQEQVYYLQTLVRSFEEKTGEYGYVDGDERFVSYLEPPSLVENNSVDGGEGTQCSRRASMENGEFASIAATASTEAGVCKCGCACGGSGGGGWGNEEVDEHAPTPIQQIEMLCLEVDDMREQLLEAQSHIDVAQTSANALQRRLDEQSVARGREKIELEATTAARNSLLNKLTTNVAEFTVLTRKTDRTTHELERCRTLLGVSHKQRDDFQKQLATAESSRQNAQILVRMTMGKLEEVRAKNKILGGYINTVRTSLGDLQSAVPAEVFEMTASESATASTPKELLKRRDATAKNKR